MLGFLQSAFASVTGAAGAGAGAAVLAAGHRVGTDAAVWLRGGWLRLRTYGATEGAAMQHLYAAATARAPAAAAAVGRLRATATAGAVRLRGAAGQAARATATLRAAASARVSVQWHSAARLLAGPERLWNAALTGRLRV